MALSSEMPHIRSLDALHAVGGRKHTPISQVDDQDFARYVLSRESYRPVGAWVDLLSVWCLGRHLKTPRLRVCAEARQASSSFHDSFCLVVWLSVMEMETRATCS